MNWYVDYSTSKSGTAVWRRVLKGRRGSSNTSWVLSSYCQSYREGVAREGELGLVADGGIYEVVGVIRGRVLHLHCHWIASDAVLKVCQVQGEGSSPTQNLVGDVVVGNIQISWRIQQTYIICIVGNVTQLYNNGNFFIWPWTLNMTFSLVRLKGGLLSCALHWNVVSFSGNCLIQIYWGLYWSVALQVL